MKKIDMLVMDVDGTLTDGKIYMGCQGEIIKAFNIRDGYAICHLLPQYGIEPVVMTGRKSLIVEKRCGELGIQRVYQNCKNKKNKLLEIAKDKGMVLVNGKMSGVAFIGDDIQDIPAMEISEYSGCPSDAVYEVKTIVDYICDNRGGGAAVREFIEWLLYKK